MVLIVKRRGGNVVYIVGGKPCPFFLINLAKIEYRVEQDQDQSEARLSRDSDIACGFQANKIFYSSEQRSLQACVRRK